MNFDMNDFMKEAEEIVNDTTDKFFTLGFNISKAESLLFINDSNQENFKF